MCAATQKYNFQVEQQTFPCAARRLRCFIVLCLQGTDLLCIKFKHIGEMITRSIHMSHIHSFQTLVLGHFAFFLQPMRKGSAALKRTDDLHNKLKGSHWKTAIYIYIYIYIYIPFSPLLVVCVSSSTSGPLPETWEFEGFCAVS